MKTITLIGGPLAGHKAPVSGHDHEVRFATTGASAKDHPPFGLKEDSYTARDFRFLEGTIRVFAHKALSDFEVVSALIEGYGKQLPEP